MLITKDMVIGGMSAPDARALVRLAVAPRVVDPDLVRRRLPHVSDPVEATRRLVAEGYLEEVTTAGGEALFGCTIAGSALAKARIGRPMPRAKAEQILAAVIGRALEINSDPDELHTVETIELFGSLGDPTISAVGDVDLRVVYSVRVDPDTYLRRSLDVAAASGRALATFVDELAFAQLRFQRRLRGRQRADIQFDQDEAAPLPPNAQPVIVFERDATSRR